MRASVSVGRINNFIKDTEQLDDQPRTSSTQGGDSKTAIHISNANFRFSRYGSTGFTLKVDDLKIPKNSTTIIAGDVGSGKSAFLLALLGELSLRSGKVEMLTESGELPKISYAAQSPWLQGE
jgi:ABC-type bacteriocin/lantibiotic exporter with double-glycine peptidase domain